MNMQSSTYPLALSALFSRVTGSERMRPVVGHLRLSGELQVRLDGRRQLDALDAGEDAHERQQHDIIHGPGNHPYGSFAGGPQASAATASAVQPSSNVAAARSIVGTP